MKATIGPDAYRYIALGVGKPVPRPFHLRWLLPTLCDNVGRRWWAVWLASWPVLLGGMFGWRLAAGDRWQVAAAAAALLAGLPGVLGPAIVIPVGVDLPATAMSLLGVMFLEIGGWTPNVLGITALCVGAMVRETVPVWSSLWLWSPLPLVAMVPVVVRMLLAQTGPDPLGGQFDEIAAHPLKAGLQAHAGRWRDGWLMVAPWGVCLAALYTPDWRLGVILAAAYLQLLIATDTVRLVHHAAGPVLAAAAAHHIPPQWLVIAVVAHVMWWRTPERI